jgi:hypothetical protein
MPYPGIVVFDGSALSIARASRAARLGTRSVKLIRLLRLLKLRRNLTYEKRMPEPPPSPRHHHAPRTARTRVSVCDGSDAQAERKTRT